MRRLTARCDADALSRVTFGEQAATDCADTSGFSFFVVTARPSDKQIRSMCGIEACRSVVAAIKSVAPSECQLATQQEELYLYKDLLDPINWTCGFEAGSNGAVKAEGTATAGPSSHDGSDGSGQNVSMRSSSDSGGGLGVGPIVAMILGAIVCGLLSAFIAVRVKRGRSSSMNKYDDGNHFRSDGISVGPGDETDEFESRREYADFTTVAVASKVGSEQSRASTVRSSKPSMGSYDEAMGSGSFVAGNTESPLKDPPLMMLRIPITQIKIDKMINQGGYGEVYRGRFDGKLAVAIKKLLPERRRITKDVAQFLGEAKLMAYLHHERIVRLVGVAWDDVDQDPWVVSEFANGGDLRSLLQTYEKDKRLVGFSFEKVKIALHVAEALHYLHSLSPVVLHRDLKSRNVLLTSELDALVTDFGVSRERSNNTMTADVGTSLWMAPEVMVGERYDEKADVFSFGVMLSEIDTHRLPYADALHPESDARRLPLPAILRLVALGKLSVAFSDGADADMVALGRQCVSLDPRERPSAAESLQRVNQVMGSYVAFV